MFPLEISFKISYKYFKKSNKFNVTFNQFTLVNYNLTVQCYSIPLNISKTKIIMEHFTFIFRFVGYVSNTYV